MSLILAVTVLAVIAGYLLGGRLRALAAVPVRALWLVWIAFGLQLLLAFLSDDARDAWRIPIVFAAFAVVLTWIALQWRRLTDVLRVALAVVALGWGLNLTVISLNNGMPVSEEALERVGLPTDDIESGDLNKHVEDDGAKLWWLGDVIPLPLFATLRKAVSLGDLVMLAGLAVFIPAGMRRPRREDEPSAAVPADLDAT